MGLLPHALVTVSMSSLQAPEQPFQLSAVVVPKAAEAEGAA